ncbi:hypothetical protein [Sphingomonas sp.]|jgi:hypothetical protein|uniref:hypothetical protein n=1 Tax=Sphingomonas sp. TaxID=28214 RepID=UPI002627A4C4|nr:hypothetical protein [Sphingomonas sp.]MDF2495048.1 hypothetical protein [Sphingomonas sp.]
MVVKRNGTDVIRYLVPAALLVAGIIIAASIAAMPRANFDLLVWRLGLPSLIPAAAPPVGATGRTLLALIALFPFLVAAALAWRLSDGKPMMRLRRPLSGRVPALRRADAHPDHPPRWPIRADEDLGPPLPAIDSLVRRSLLDDDLPLPADLEQTLAAFDPIAIPDVPREPARPVAPLVTIVVPARSEESEAADEDYSFEVLDETSPETLPDPVEEAAVPAELPPIQGVVAEDMPVEDAPVAPAAELSPFAGDLPSDAIDTPAPVDATPEPEHGQTDHGGNQESGDSIAALLDRLERGAQRRKDTPPPTDPAPPSPPPSGSLDDTLVMLRRMARG